MAIMTYEELAKYDEELSLGKDILGRTVIEGDRTMVGPEGPEDEFRGGHVDDFGPEDEGISANGAEGLGGHGDGFEVQNQGVTRRAPGEAPKADGGRPQAQEMDPVHRPEYGDAKLNPDAYLEDFYENEMPFGGMDDPQGWDRQIAQGNTSGGSDVSDEDPAAFPAPRRFDIMRGQPKVREMFGIDEVSTEGDITWNPGEYGADVKRVLKGLVPDSPLHTRLTKVGAAGQVAISDDEAHALEDALSAFVSSKRYTKPDVEFAEDILQQLCDRGGDDPGEEFAGEYVEQEGVDDMKKAVRGMKHVVGRMSQSAEKLRKSSEKEKREHPWATDRQADRIARDHAKLGEGIARVFVFKDRG